MHKLIKKYQIGGLSLTPIPTQIQKVIPSIPDTIPQIKIQPMSSSISGKQGFDLNKFNSIVGNLGKLNNLIPQQEQSALTTGLNSGYDTISNSISNIPGIGTVIGGAMKIGGLLSDGLTSLGVGTDQMTTTDKILDSKFLKLTPIGLINSIGAKKSDTIYKDNEAFEQVGASYGGVSSKVDDALTKSGKKYGLFSNKSRRNANSQIAEAKRQQGVMSNIADNANDAFTRQSSMSDINNRRYSFQLSGGYQTPLRVGQKGLKFPTKEQIDKAKKLAQSKKSSNRSLDELIVYAKQQNPRFIQRLSEPPRGIDFIDDSGNKARGSHYLESAGEYVIPRIQEVNGELKFFNHQDAVNRAIETGNYLKMTPEEAKLFAKEYKKGWPEFFKKFKSGGKMNVIPEGALHARLHHMDMEGITKKGIPVITKEDGGEIVQHAEIERDEIIFTKEVTEKLEDLYKKGTDEAAIEAGKILAKEIMENTQDNTGLMQTIS